jgi:arylsulfatase A
VKEFAFDREYKLYRTGEFYRLNEDLNEQRPLATTSLSPEETQALAKLQAALEQFTDARPQELDRAFEEIAPKQPKKKAKKP